MARFCTLILLLFSLTPVLSFADCGFYQAHADEWWDLLKKYESNRSDQLDLGEPFERLLKESEENTIWLLQNKWMEHFAPPLLKTIGAIEFAYEKKMFVDAVDLADSLAEIWSQLATECENEGGE